MPQEKLELKLSEQEADRKAMYFWNGAGKPVDQYPIYREAVERWNQAGANDGDFDECLRRSRKTSLLARGVKSIAWPILISSVVVVGAAIAAVLVVLHEVRVNREILQATVEMQREQNRQQILKDYVIEMTTLMAEKDLVSKYRKNEKGEYDPEGTEHSDAIAASSLTQTVLQLLDKGEEITKTQNSSEINNEKGALVLFLYESRLIHQEKPVINLKGANLNGANLKGANLKG